MPLFAGLVIEKGNSYEKGTYLSLQENKIVVGRSTVSFIPEVNFDNLLISRRHCSIGKCNGSWLLSDLGSKHGTTLNGQPILPFSEHILSHGDKIGLAAGVVVFRIVFAGEVENTMELDKTQPTKVIDGSQAALPVTVDLQKMTLLVNNQEVPLSGKEWLLLEILHRNRNRFVSYEEIKKVVWAERGPLDNNSHDVGVDEINVLIYRLRRKLGVHARLVRTLRGRGCIFGLE